MTRKSIILLIALCAFSAHAADLNLRTLEQTWDVNTTASKKVAQVEFYRGESFALTLQAKAKGQPVDLSATNLVTTWELAEWDALTNGWIILTGTVANATNGLVHFALTPDQTEGLAPGMYRGEVWAWQAEDTNMVKAALLAAQRVEVLASAGGRYTVLMDRAPFPWEATAWAVQSLLQGQVNALSNDWKSTDTTVQWLEGWQSSFSNDWTNHTESFQRLESSSAEIGSNLTSEATARLAGDAAASSNLATEAATRLASTSLLGSNITAEVAARIAGDAVASSNLATEAATRLAATSLLGSNLTTEATARIEGDAAASSNLATEAATRLAATSLLTSNLTSEASARIEADAAITGRIDVVETTALTSVRCSGGWYHPDYFTLSFRPYPYRVISEGETNAVYSVYVSQITVDTAAGHLLEPSIVRMSTFTGGVAYAASSNCTIQTVTVTNWNGWALSTSTVHAVIFDAELEAGAVAEITATLGGYTRTASLTYAVSNWYTYNQYQGDVPGSLRAYVNTSLAARASNTNASIKLYEDGWPSYGTGGTWTRNTNCWIGNINLTCASPYNSQENQVEKGGTAITRQHIAFAEHYQITNGASVLFVDGTNGLHWRTMTASRRIGLTDAMIGLLDSPLPESITPASLMQPSDNGRFLGAQNMSGGIGVRTVHLKAVESNDPHTFAKWACYSYAYIDGANGIVGSASAATGRADANSVFSAGVIVGDSGQPTFILIGTNTVLYSTFHSSLGGPNYAYLSSYIEAAIASMGNSVYTNLHYINLDAWRDLNLPSVP